MRYYFDTEFIEDGEIIDLISIGIVTEDGREYYAVNRDCNFSKASDWVLDNVLQPIGLDRSGFNRNPGDASVSANYKNSYAHSKSKKLIRSDIAGFCGCMTITTMQVTGNRWIPFLENYKTTDRFELDKNMPAPELWGNYCAYDFVVFSQLMSMFGRNTHNPMSDCYPKGLPWYANDLQQDANRLGVDLYEAVPHENEHHALTDAKWNKQAHEYLLNGCRL
jgi:hypothetical protein